eukprot:SAG11_NODE_3008_length_2770_cov_2.049383_2_plen_371_part_00
MIVPIGGQTWAAPQAFILNATVRDNVTFGRQYEPNGFYDRVIAACALDRDLENMKRGDLSEIGEGGATISGGQKQRVSLARTAFADADVVLLDDCLSAVDANVGAHIWQHCIKDLMGGKTRVLVSRKALSFCCAFTVSLFKTMPFRAVPLDQVTHALQYLAECDMVLVMDKGRIVEQGTLAELLAAEAPVLSALMESHEAGKQVTVEAAEADAAGGSTPKQGAEAGAAAAEHTAAGAAAAAAAGSDDADADDGDGDGDENDLTGKETRTQTGAVEWGVFFKYIKAAGLRHAAGLILFYISDTAVQALSTYWLVWWGADRFRQQASWYTARLGVLSLAQVGLVLGRLVLRSDSAIRCVEASRTSFCVWFHH